MNKYKWLLTLAVIMLFALSAIAADEAKQTEPEKKVEFRNQTLCPVMGGPIDSTVYTDIQGQRVYHCCPMCSAKLKADPDKYFMEAAEQGILFENIQTTCPVSGEPIDKAVYADYNGRRIYFCCEKCIAEFVKMPDEYLNKLTPSGTVENINKGQQGNDNSKKEQMDH
ncbi:MAG: YHS domain-containing protein [Candidatus Zixiibacteriota bacterium]